MGLLLPAVLRGVSMRVPLFSNYGAFYYNKGKKRKKEDSRG